MSSEKPSPEPTTLAQVAALMERGDIDCDDTALEQRTEYDVEAINRQYALLILGGEPVIVKQQEDGPIEDRLRFYSIRAFDRWFSTKFTDFQCPDGKRRVVTWARAWHMDPRRRQYAGIEFFPNPDGAPSTEGYLNLWRGFSITPSHGGSYAVFRDHLFNNVCGARSDLFDWVFGFFARIVQTPRERIGTGLILRGRMGTGKSKVGEVIGSLFPQHYCQVDDPRYVVGNFNAHMSKCLLLQAEEAVFAGDKHAEGIIKGLVTQQDQWIESKGVN